MSEPWEEAFEKWWDKGSKIRNGDKVSAKLGYEAGLRGNAERVKALEKVYEFVKSFHWGGDFDEKYPEAGREFNQTDEYEEGQWWKRHIEALAAVEVKP